MARAKQPRALETALLRSWARRGPLACMLWPVSRLFGLLVALRSGLYRIGILSSQQLPVTVLVIGNVVAGGSGKTPVLMALVKHLHRQGWRVGVISRGYGRVTKDCREVMANSQVCDVGDEPALIKQVTGTPVFVAARRTQAGEALLAHYPDTQIILCDDGLQHLALQRNLEICVFDDRGTGNGFLLPAGPLREPWPRTVDLVLHTGAQPAFAGFRATRQLAPCARRKDGSQVALSDLTNGKPLLALAAIAKPEDFFNMLREAGLPLAKTLALPDHHDFADWSTSAYQDFTLLCTEKDAVKLWHKDVRVLAIPLILEPEPAFLRQLDQLLADLPTHDPKLSSHHGHTIT